MCFRAKAEINLSHLTHNLKELSKNSTNLIVMLKANAYGHGLCEVAKEIDKFKIIIGVASIEEGLELRRKQIKSDIIIFSGFFSQKQEALLIKYRLIPVIHSLYQLKMIQSYCASKNASIWLKLNTGMNRLGLSSSNFNIAYKDLQQYRNITINALTHLAESEISDDTFTQVQIKQFNAALKNKDFYLVSGFNSAASLRYPNQYNTNRSGISIYGISTLEDKEYRENIKPVMTLKSQIIAINYLPENKCIGYNRTYVTTKNTKIAVVPIGYGDGYPQTTPNGTSVLINGIIAPIVGKVSMDLMTIDVTNITEIDIGDEVTLFGDHLPAEIVASQISISPYALTACITKRVVRVYI